MIANRLIVGVAWMLGAFLAPSILFHWCFGCGGKDSPAPDAGAPDSAAESGMPDAEQGDAHEDAVDAALD